MRKFEFVSPAYVDELRRQLADALATKDLRGTEFCLSEEYTNPPKHLLKPGKSSIGFHIRLSRGEFEVKDYPDSNGDMVTVADYQTVLPFARHIRGIDSKLDAEFVELRQRMVAAGKIKTNGGPDLVPPVLREAKLHNKMAAITL